MFTYVIFNSFHHCFIVLREKVFHILAQVYSQVCYCFWYNCNFFNFPFCYFIVGTQKWNRFICIDFVSYDFTEFFYQFQQFLVDYLCFSIYDIMSSADRENANSCFLIRISFISFSCVIVVASSTMLNKIGESGYPCLAHDLRGKFSVFHH